MRGTGGAFDAVREDVVQVVLVYCYKWPFYQTGEFGDDGLGPELKEGALFGYAIYSAAGNVCYPEVDLVEHEGV